MPKRFTILEGQPTTRPEASETFKEAVRDLEKQEGVGSITKMLILATARGMKPATEFGMGVPEAKEKFNDLLKRLGLEFEYEDAETPGMLQYYIAREKERAQELQELFSAAKSPDGDIRTGLAVGYPKTAVEAFHHARATGDHSVLLDDAEKWKNFGLVDGEFLFFAPSKQHWPAERAYLQKIIRETEALSPELYRKIKYETD